MADTSMSYLYTVGGYVALAGVGYVIYQVSTQKSRRRASNAQIKPSRGAQSEPRKEDKKKKQRMESFTSESHETKPKLSKPRSKAPETSTLLNKAPSNDTSDDDGVDNREFARQLSKAKEGAKFNTKTDSGKQKEKSVKQSRANQIAAPAEENTVVTSSANEGDAEDDDSGTSTPAEASADPAGVADMLEPAPAAPSVLRLTDTAPKEKKKKAAKAPEPVETKKQRQNRKKAEAAKAAREEAEKERKALEEKQRRTARIAEGRAAKDGSQFVASTKANSAWNQGAPNGESATKAAGTNGTHHQLLDTFEAPSEPRPTAPKQESSWMSSLPSEEEQLEMIKHETDEWSTVKTKSSKRSIKKDSSVDSGDEPSQSRPSAQPKPSTTASAPTKASSNFGSFAALTKDEPAEDVEEEWDV